MRFRRFSSGQHARGGRVSHHHPLLHGPNPSILIAICKKDKQNHTQGKHEASGVNEEIEELVPNMQKDMGRPSRIQSHPVSWALQLGNLWTELSYSPPLHTYLLNCNVHYFSFFTIWFALSYIHSAKWDSGHLP